MSSRGAGAITSGSRTPFLCFALLVNKPGPVMQNDLQSAATQQVACSRAKENCESVVPPCSSFPPTVIWSKRRFGFAVAWPNFRWLDFQQRELLLNECAGEIAEGCLKT